MSSPPTYYVGKYISNPDLVYPNNLFPDYEYALLYNSTLWRWDGILWVSEPYPLYGTFNDPYSNTVFILNTNINTDPVSYNHYQTTFCGSYYQDITSVQLDGNLVLEFLNGSSQVIVSPDVGFLLITDPEPMVFFYSTDATIQGWYMLEVSRFIFSDRLTNTKYVIDVNLNSIGILDCSLLTNAINDRVVRCNFDNLSNPNDLFNNNVSLNPQLFTTPLGIVSLTKQPQPSTDRYKFLVSSTSGIPNNAIQFDENTNLWIVDTAQATTSPFSFTLSGCDETGGLCEVYLFSPIGGSATSLNSTTMYYETSDTSSITVPIFGSYVLDVPITSVGYNRLSYVVNVGPGTFTIDTTPLAPQDQLYGFFTYTATFGADFYLVSYIIKKSFVNGRMVLFGSDSSTKFQILDSLNNDVLNVNTITKTVSSNGVSISPTLLNVSIDATISGNLLLQGANNVAKMIVKTNGGSDMFIVDTLNQIITANLSTVNFNTTSAPSVSISSTNDVIMQFNSNSTIRTIRVINASGQFEFNDDIIPSNTALYSLGTSSLRWINIFSEAINTNDIINNGSYTQFGTDVNNLTGPLSITSSTEGNLLNIISQNAAIRPTINFSAPVSVSGSISLGITGALEITKRIIINSDASTTAIVSNITSPGTVTTSLILANNATVSGSGVAMRFTGFSGSSITNGSIQFNGTNMSYFSESNGNHQFNTSLSAISYTATFSQSGVNANRLNLTNSGTGAGTGVNILMQAHNGTNITNTSVSMTDNTFSLTNNSVSGEFTFNRTVRPSAVSPLIDLGTNAIPWSTLYVNNPVVVVSDRDKKKDIHPESLGLDFVCQLQPVSYKLIVNENNKSHHGLIAQDVEEVLQKNNITEDDFAALNKDDQGNYSLSYTEFIAPMIKAIQELKSIVQYQEQEIQSLKSLIK